MRNIFTTLIFAFLLLAAGSTGAQTTYTAPGTYTYTIPSSGIIKIEAWGGGGGAGFNTTGGGGGGAYSSATVSVTANQTVTIVVGTGGGSASDGGNSRADTGMVTVVLAEGGKGGVISSSGGAGGLASNGTGSVKWSGGSGAPSGIGIGGGGGGGSAFATANGGNGGSPAGGTGQGNGGAGAGASPGPGGNGFAPGGGGGGSNGSFNGGSGAAGQVIITTVCVTPVVNRVPHQIFCVGAANVVFTGTSGTVYNWTNNNTAIGLPASGSGNLSFTATNGTTAPISGTITVTPVTGPCSGSPVTFTITVNPNPDLSQPANQVACNGSATAPVNFTSTVPGTTFSWTNNTPSIGLAAGGTGNIASFPASNTGTTPVTATIIVTPNSQPGQLAYIGNLFSSNVSLINLTTNTVVGTIPSVNSPYGVVINPAGTRVYMIGSSGTISVISTATNTVTGTISGGSAPLGAVVSPDGAKLYVADYFSNNLRVINTATNTLITTVPTGTHPFGVAISADGSKVYVANQSTNNVTVIDAATNAVTNTIPAVSGATDLTFNLDGSKLYVSGEFTDIITIINTATNTVSGTIPLPGGSDPFVVLVSPDGTRLYVGNENVNTVSVFNTATNTLIGTIPVGNLPQGMSLSADGSRLYVANTNSNTVSVINTTTNTVTHTIPVGNGPWAYGNFLLEYPACGGTSKSFTITVNPTPNAVATPSGQAACSGTAITTIALSGNVPGTVYNWTRDNTGPVTGIAAGGSGNISGTLTNATASPVTVTFTITPSYTNAGVTCTGTAITATVVVNPTPVVGITGGGTFCGGTTVTLAATAGFASYSWFRFTSAGQTPMGITTPTLTVTQSGNYQVVVSNGTCTGSVLSVAEIGDYLFTGAMTAGDPTTATRLFLNSVTPTCAAPKACPGNSGAAGPFAYDLYTVTNPNANPVCAVVALTASCSDFISASAYLGSYDPLNHCTNYLGDLGSAILGGPLAMEVTIPGGATVVIKVNNFGSGLYCNNYRLVVDIPRVAAGITMIPASPQCTGTPITLTASTANSYSWSPGAATTQSIVHNSGTTNYTVKLGYGNQSACSTNVSQTVTVANPAVNPVPDTTFCAAAAASVAFTGGTSGTIYNWTNDNTAIGLPASGSGNLNFTATNGTSAPISGTITVTPVFGPCTGTPITFTITVNPTNSISRSSAPGTDGQTVCINTPITNITYATTVATGASFSGLPMGVSGAWAANTATISGSPSVSGVFNYTVTTTGGCGTAQATGSITVNAGPTLSSCPGAQTAYTPSNGCATAVSYAPPMMGGTPAPAMSYALSGATTNTGLGSGSGQLFSKGITLVKIYAENVCGKDSCVFNVTVLDTVRPLLTCPGNIVLSTDPDSTAKIATFIAGASDNCTGVSVVSAPPSGYSFPIGVTIVTSTATDVSGNSRSCSFTVTIEDHQKPTIIDPDSVVQYVSADSCGARVYFEAYATDNNQRIAMGATCKTSLTCSNNNGCPKLNDCRTTRYDTCACKPVGSAIWAIENSYVVVSPASGSLFPTGATMVHVTAQDVSGNITLDSFQVIVKDTVEPVARCKAGHAVTLSGGTASITAANIDSLSTDNCGAFALSLSVIPSTFTCANAGNNLVTLTATDASGNSRTCTSNVMVNGSAVTPGAITVTPAAGLYTGGIPTTLYLGYGPQTATLTGNASGGSSLTYSWSPAGSLSCTACQSTVITPTAAGNYTRTVTATNSNGCSASSSVTICVKDPRVPGSGGKTFYICHQLGGAAQQNLQVTSNLVSQHLGPHPLDKLGMCGVVCSGPGLRGPEATEELIEEVKIYPNPSDGSFTVALPYISESTAILVTDLQGRKVSERRVTAEDGNLVRFNLNLAQGMYFVIVRDEVQDFRTRLFIR